MSLRHWLLLNGISNIEIIPLARAAESAGFHGIALGDHVALPVQSASVHPSGRAPFDTTSPFPDTFTAIAAMAAATSTLNFVTYVYVPALRHPLTTAKQVATAADISCGRVSLGVGVGWIEEEFDACGQSFSDRAQRTDEILVILKQAWETGVVEHDSDAYRIVKSTFVPTPSHRIAIYTGGTSHAALTRAVHHDGWLARRVPHFELARQIERVQELKAARSRPTEFRIFAVPYEGPAQELETLESTGLTDVVVPLWWFGDGIDHPTRLRLINEFTPSSPVAIP